jgi:hypothetical protein
LVTTNCFADLKKKKKRGIFTVMIVLICCLAVLSFAQRRFDIVPFPQSLEEREQNFVWRNGTTIIIPR